MALIFLFLRFRFFADKLVLVLINILRVNSGPTGVGLCGWGGVDDVNVRLHPLKLKLLKPSSRSTGKLSAG